MRETWLQSTERNSVWIKRSFGTFRKIEILDPLLMIPSKYIHVKNNKILWVYLTWFL